MLVLLAEVAGEPRGISEVVISEAVRAGISVFIRRSACPEGAN